MKTIETAVREAVSPIARRYFRYVDRADLIQECYAWAVSHPKTVQSLADNSQAYLTRRLRTIAERYARREKAVKVGYSPDDELYYSFTRLVELLPDAFDPEATPPQTGYSDVASSRERTFQEWETAIADVRQGLKQIPPAAQGQLRRYVVDNVDETDPDFVSAVRCLQRRLGGPRPHHGGLDNDDAEA